LASSAGRSGYRSKLRHELLNGEVFYNLKEARVLIERWRRHYNTLRPHSALGYRPPAPETILPHAADLPSAAQGFRADRHFKDGLKSLN